MDGPYGLTSYGLGPYGGAPGTLFLVGAVATSIRTVQVTLSTSPQRSSGFMSGDALNPKTWTVTRLDTGATIQVLAVRSITRTVYELLLLSPLGPVRVTHEVETTTLLSVAGALIESPQAATFLGVVRDNLPQGVPSRQYAPRDIANPPFASTDTVGGTLLVTSEGDYAYETGIPLVRKLIIRRLTTTPGEFFHLPTYGLGIAIKEPLRVADMPTLQGEIERQVALEPEVERAQASLTLTSDGVLTIKVRAKVRPTGQLLDVSLEVPQVRVSL